MAQQKINTLLKKIAEQQKLQAYKIVLNPISTDGANYTSTLFIATISSENKEDIKLFTKVAAMGENMRDNTGSSIYLKEKYIYEEFKDTIRSLERRKGINARDRLGMAEYYGASTTFLEEVIVLGDLTSKGFSCHDRFKPIDWEYASTAVSELSKLHAISFALEQDNPNDFLKTMKFLQYDLIGDLKSMDAFWNGSKLTAIGAVNEENREQLVAFLNALNTSALYALFEPFKHQVLVHGDYRVSNLMHGRRTDGSLEIIPVDYQTIRGGSQVVDLYYFIFTGTDAAFRAEYYEKLLDHYYAELSAAMKRLGLNPDEKYSKQDYEEELKEKLPFGLAVAVLSLPIVTVDPENAPKLDENMTVSDFSVQKTGSSYPARINGVVDDFVKWGVI